MKQILNDMQIDTDNTKITKSKITTSKITTGTIY